MTVDTDLQNIWAAESYQVKNIMHEPFTCICSSPPLQNHYRYMNGISEKKNQIQNWQAHTYLTFFIIII